VDIPTIFEFEGESGFRDREQKVIEKLTELNGIVLATGGGAIIREENRVLLTKNGFVVYLQCSIDRIMERTRRDTQRPLLQTDNPRLRLKQLYTERQPLYLSSSHYRIDSGLNRSKVVVSHILEEFHKYNQDDNIASTSG
jgi:shikimate kinase